MQAQEERKVKDGVFFRGFHGQSAKKYPAWRYHKTLEPVLVHNKEQDEEVRKKGWEPVFIPITANKYLSNWFWDLEDMSAKQLSIFCREEYGIILPVEAGQERLLKAVLKLSHLAPQNAGRIVYMAHTIKMNLDEVQEEIRNAQNQNPTLEKESFTAWV